MAQNIPLANSGYLSRLCPLPAVMPTPRLLAVGAEGRKGESLVPVEAFFSNNQSTGVFLTVLVENPKHSAM